MDYGSRLYLLWELIFININSCEMRLICRYINDQYKKKTSYICLRTGQAGQPTEFSHKLVNGFPLKKLLLINFRLESFREFENLSSIEHVVLNVVRIKYSPNEVDHIIKLHMITCLIEHNTFNSIAALHNLKNLHIESMHIDVSNLNRLRRLEILCFTRCHISHGYVEKRDPLSLRKLTLINCRDNSLYHIRHVITHVDKLSISSTLIYGIINSTGMITNSSNISTNELWLDDIRYGIAVLQRVSGFTMLVLKNMLNFNGNWLDDFHQLKIVIVDNSVICGRLRDNIEIIYV